MSKHKQIGFLFTIVCFLFTITLFFTTRNTTAQTPIPVGDVSNGIVIYQSRCANCHGALGLGDGELSQQGQINPTPLGNPDYVQSVIPGIQYEIIDGGRVSRGMPPFGETSSNPLSIQEIWDVIAATHALGTNSADILTAQPLITDDIQAILQQTDWARQPLSSIAASLADFGLDGDDALTVAQYGRATIAEKLLLGEQTFVGQAINATTNEPLADQTVTLVVYEEFEATETRTTQTDENGNFAFQFDAVSADWVLRAETDYAGLFYNSNFVRFGANATPPPVQLAVYNSSDDPSLLSLSRLRVIGELIGEEIFINELYRFENVGQAIFSAEIPIILPPNIENISFFQLLPSGEFAPVPNVVPMANGFNYPNPISPQEPLDLLVRYSQPYNNGAVVTHDLAFTAQTATLALPEGVEMTAAGWTLEGVDELEGERFVGYSAEIPLNTLSLTFDGQTRFVIDPETGFRVPIRNERTELLIGGVALAVTIGVCAYLITLWQNAKPQDPSDILAQIAALDDAFAAKQIKRKPYEKQRLTLLQKARDLIE